jgi:hypothetical protein
VGEASWAKVGVEVVRPDKGWEPDKWTGGGGGPRVPLLWVETGQRYLCPTRVTLRKPEPGTRF